MSKGRLSLEDQEKMWGIAKFGKTRARVMALGFILISPFLIACMGICEGFPSALKDGGEAVGNACKLFLPWE